MRWGLGRLGLGLGLALGLSESAACGESSFACLDDGACQGLEGGMCEPSGFCSQADPDCESGQRYAPHAGMLAGACVAPGGTSTGTPTTGGAVATDSASASTLGSGGDSGSETTGSQTTNMMVDQTTSSTEPATETSDGQSSSSTGPPASIYDFEDDFERVDSPELGNGWREKTEDAFVLLDGAARRDVGTADFPNNLVYRPGLLIEGVEVHMTFRYLGDQVEGFPQVHARLDEAASEAPGPSTSYVLYVPGGQLDLTRVDAGSFTGLGNVTPDMPVALGEDYRFRLRISAGAPATLDGYLDHLEGEAWVQIAELHNTDAEPLPAGTMGFSGASEMSAYEYEHIGWFEI